MSAEAAGKKQKQEVSAQALFGTDINAIIASAGDDKKTLDRLRAYASNLQKAAVQAEINLRGCAVLNDDLGFNADCCLYVRLDIYKNRPPPTCKRCVCKAFGICRECTYSEKYINGLSEFVDESGICGVMLCTQCNRDACTRCGDMCCHKHGRLIGVNWYCEECA